MARVEMIDRDPVEFRSQILFRLRHQPARERLQVVILFAILRRDDEAELVAIARLPLDKCLAVRSEEHTSELQSLMRISYAVFCLKKKKNSTTTYNKQIRQREVVINSKYVDY